MVSSTRRGTIVTSDGADAAWRSGRRRRRGVIDLTVNRPAVDDFRERLAETLPRIAERPSAFASCRNTSRRKGLAWARAAGKRWIALNGISRPASTTSSLPAAPSMRCFAVISGLIEPGDVIAPTGLTYYGLKALAQMFRFWHRRHRQRR